MKGRLSLSELSKASPNKRKSDQSRTNASSVKPRAIIEPGNPNWPCPSPACDGHIKVVKKMNGQGEFGSCDQRVYGDDNSCQATTTILQPSKDNAKYYLVCNTPVGGTPTLGEPTEEKDDRGYTVWNNVHACFNLCCGAKTSDNSRFKNGTEVASGQPVVGKACFMSAGGTGKDINNVCTGKIKGGDVIVKEWEDPPLHLWCSKRLWEQSVSGILDTKKTYKELGTTHEEEYAKPSATVKDSFKDF
ncbi:unnamed protein product [Pylaiella littoralis]